MDNGDRIQHSGPIDGSSGYNDAIHLSGVKDFVGQFGTVTSGSEDCIDCNNGCEGIDATATLWVLKGSMGFTIKGGTKDVHLQGTVLGHGKETDVDIGNASDQSHAWVTGTQLNLFPAIPGDKIRVRVLGGDLPFETPGSGPYTYVFPWKWKPFRVLVVKIFLQIRRLGLFVQK
jgi:hypothetical protein